MAILKKGTCEVVVKIPGKKSAHSHLPLQCLGKLEAFLEKYAEDESVDWADVAEESIIRHKQAGMVLRGARFRQNLSQKSLAKKCGVSQENISRIENGKRAVAEKLAKKLAKPLKIDYRLLIQDLISK